MGNNFIRRNLKAINILELISVAAVLNNEDKLIELLAFAKKRKIRRTMIYESLLQTYLFAGIPSALISLKIFKDIFPQNNTRNKNSSKNFRLEGIKNCRKIYGNKFDKLIFNTKTFSPELAEILVNDGYGKILGRKGLNLKDRELCIISILSAMKFENQLYSHINGAYRLNIKADKIFEAIKIIDLIDGKNRSNFGINVLNKYLMNKG
jgi:alkylhydroperoxidase/carboxymuconolactone decarboxylase family protein YurZ